MTSDDLARLFEDERPRLVAVAHRMLGSRGDAEDAVQEAWLRLSRSDDARIENLAGWLTTVVGRICLDLLRARSARPLTSYDDVLVLPDDGTAPDDEAELADTVGLALLVVLETLSPAERLAFVLHDLFAVPFDEIGRILGKSADATKMMTSRARRKLRAGDEPAADDAPRRRAVVDAFLAASRGGDFEGLLAVLDPDVVLRADTPDGVVVTLGATEVAGRAQMFAALAAASRPVLVDGVTGVMSWTVEGTPMSLMTFLVEDGRIVEITSLADPSRLVRMDLPSRA